MVTLPAAVIAQTAGLAHVQNRFSTSNFSDVIALAMTEDGLGYGSDIQLASIAKPTDSISMPHLGRDGGHALALMSLAAGRSMPTETLNHLEAAFGHWTRGDKALANLRLVFFRLPQISDPAEADRLRLAAYLLDEGMAPAELMTELGFDAAVVEMKKYDANQPRVPAGSGRESGRWTDGSAGSGRIAFVNPGVAPTLLAGASSSVVDGLIAISTRVATPLVLFGAVFVPTPNTGGVVEGPVPGAADVTFRKDGSAGTLRLTAQIDDGLQVVVAAENRAGLYVNVRTGAAIGRDLGEQLYLDLDSVHAAVDTEVAVRTGEDPDRKPQAAIDEPRLCPMPMKDVPHGSTIPSLEYEDDVHARANPMAPLPRGFGVNLIDPESGRPVHFDDCFRYAGDLVDGDMHAGDLVEAKGTVDFYLSGQVGAGAIDKFIDQANKELRVARARGVGLKYYFAESSAALRASELFQKRGLDSIIVSHMPRSKAK